MAQYLLKSERHLVQYLASNLLNKGYLFYSLAYLPEDADAELVDAKLLVRHESWKSKEWNYRRRKAGFATVRYLRCGRQIVILATKGKSPFFQKEDWKDAREAPLNLFGYSLKVDKATLKVSCRIHREAQRRIRREWMEDAGLSAREWEERIWGFEFLPFAGVRDGLFALIRDLNLSRKLLRKPPIDWKRCVRKRIKPEPVFEETPKEIVELLEHYRRQK